MINIAICDDNAASVKIISGSISQMFSMHGIETKVYTYSSARALAEGARIHLFDLIFLDIEMPGTDGIELSRQLRKKGSSGDIIFVSNREDRVFETFEVHPFGFVRKSTFVRDISSVLSFYIEKYNAARNAHPLLVKTKEGLIALPTARLIYIEGNQKNQLAYLENLTAPVTINSSMEKLEEKLASDGFIRVHKGYIVNYRYIRLIGTGECTLVNGDVLPLSRRKAKEVKEKYLEYVQSNSVVAF